MSGISQGHFHSAHHDVWPALESRNAERVEADLVGPICESGDFLSRGAKLPAMEPGNLLALDSAGAYGFVMASNYNARPRAAEVLVESASDDSGQASARLIRRRESYADLIRGEE